MATRNWTEGAGTGVLSTGGNWDTIPAAGDTAYVQQGSLDLTGDLSGVGALAAFYVSPGWRGSNIGTPATAAKLYVTSGSGDLVVQGSGNLNLVNLNAAGGGVDRARVTYCRDFLFDGGTWAEVEIGNVGSSIAGANTTLGEYRVLGGKHIIDTGTGGTGPSLMIVGPGADVRIRRTCPDNTRVYVFGTLIVEDGANLGTVANSLVYVAPGGYINNRSATSLPPVEIITGGRVDQTDAKKDVTYNTLRDWPNSMFEERPVGVLANVTTRKPVIKR